MSYQDENSPKPETKSFVAGINNAFFDFSQDFNQKYHSHHLIDFPEINSLFSDKTLEFSYSLDNESMKLDHNSINQIMPQEFKDEPDYQHIQSHLSFNSMGFDCKEKQTKSLNPHLRLDFSPEMKLGLKGNSRFFSFDPEEDGLNSYWGGKSNSMKINGFEEINGFSGMAQYENFQDLKVKDQNFNQTTFQMKKNEGLFEKESGNRSSRGLFKI